MARHKVEIVNVNTANIKVLNKKENDILFIRLKNNDLSARDELVNGNLKLVLSILKKFKGKTDNLDDLFQVGCIGLLKAIDNFDISLGVSLSTYAVPMILGEIKRYLRDNSSIRISRSIKDMAYKVIEAKEKLSNLLNRDVSFQEISDYLEIPINDIMFAMDSIKEPISLFEPIYNDGGDTIYLYDQIEDKNNYLYNIEDKLSINEQLKYLSKREKQILNERFIIGKTQTEIANQLGISQAQISRLEKNAIKSIKEKLR